jgi:ABC-type branched-subunit amino acid transport system ATPase component
VVLICCVLLCVAVGFIRRGKLGQQMLAVRSNERAAAAASVNPRTVKLYAFTIAAFIAGVAGVLYSYNFGSVSAGRFDAVTALSLIAFAYAGGITLISGAVFAGLIAQQGMIQYALQDWFGLSGNWFLLFGGVVLILTLQGNPSGVAGDWYRRLHKRERISAPDVTVAAERPERGPRPDFAGKKAVLRLDGVSVSFGGVKAVQDVSLEVRDGELVGLIGPNGAGKTTLVDAVTGFVPFRGKVELDGGDISRLPAYERARRGLARTWQSTELFDDLGVAENLTVATPHANRADEGASATLDLVGMGWAAEAMPAELSAGQRKLVGVARAVVARPHVLCLDEPAAGLDTTESAELGATLRALADQGQSMLLIEHDMGLVMSVCDRVVVLEFGQVIADGPPEVVRADPRVIAAYLGQSAGDPSPEAVAADQADS